MKELLARAKNITFVGFVCEVGEIYFTRHVGRAAAQLAYFLVLTFFPILICVSAFVGRLELDLAAVLEEVGRFLPGGVNAILDEYFAYLANSQTAGMLLAGIVMTVLFASAAVRGLMNIMCEIYGRGNFYGIAQLAASVVFAVLMLLAIYLSMVVVVTGNWFFHMVERLLRLEDFAQRFDTWQWLKYLLLLSVMSAFILLLYRFTAPLTKPRPPVMAGALAASAALVAASAVFAVMVSGSTRYSLVYGSLASVIILLVWLYLCGNILILGSVVNFVIYRRRLEKGAQM